MPEGATLHGLGGRTVWDLRGATYRCWNTDPGGAWLPGDDPLYVTSPVYAVLDDHGAAHCFVDNACDATFDATGSELVAHFEAGPLRLHVSIGSLPEVLDAYTALTGRPTAAAALGARAPPGALGLRVDARRCGPSGRASPRATCRCRRCTSTSTTWTASATSRSALSTGRGSATSSRRWPPRGSARWSSWTRASPGTTSYPLYREGVERGLFCANADGSTFEGVVWPGPTVFPDFTSAQVRRWWGEQFAFYADLGVAGYWHDMNEPSNFVAWGDPTFPLSTRHDLDGRPSDHRDAHNIYGLQMCRASYDGLREVRPDERPFLFSRSGWAGMQRYGGHWSGDIEASWPSLRATLHQAFGYGVSGVGYYGSDIGGFTGRPSPELFTRWFQLASFLPFFRTHCALERTAARALGVGP